MTYPAKFLSDFTSKFPLQQNSYWTLFQFNNGMKLLLFSTLQLDQLKMALWSQPNMKGCVFSVIGHDCSLLNSPEFHPTFNPSTVNVSLTYWLPLPTMLDKVELLDNNNQFVPKPSWWYSEVSSRNSSWM